MIPGQPQPLRPAPRKRLAEQAPHGTPRESPPDVQRKDWRTKSAASAPLGNSQLLQPHRPGRGGVQLAVLTPALLRPCTPATRTVYRPSMGDTLTFVNRHWFDHQCPSIFRLKMDLFMILKSVIVTSDPWDFSRADIF